MTHPTHPLLHYSTLCASQNYLTHIQPLFSGLQPLLSGLQPLLSGCIHSGYFFIPTLEIGVHYSGAGVFSRGLLH